MTPEEAEHMLSEWFIVTRDRDSAGASGQR
jgi:hypothetical protein